MKHVEKQGLNHPDNRQSASSFDARRAALMFKLGRLNQLSVPFMQKTGFGLADQVLTHALVSAEVPFSLLVAGDDPSAMRRSIQEITVERYGLELADKTLSGSKGHVLSAGSGSEEFLHDWSENDLVRYVLDHEVPVNPEDMPGSNLLVA